MKRLIFALLIGLSVGAAGPLGAQPLRTEPPVLPQVTRILVLKGERKLQLLNGERVLSTHTIQLGRNPRGDKVFEGDGRTPEGQYIIDKRNEQSRFYRSLRISYPNEQDRAEAGKYGISPGGLIMIHGQPNNPTPWYYKHRDWTEGCIAVSNRDVDLIWSMVQLGTLIEIRP